MLLPPDMALPDLEDGQRLYICSGSPWDKALDDIRNPSQETVFEGWDVDRHYRKGGWILTYLSTRPRVLLCWE